MANFLPLSPPTSHAGRTFSCARHDNIATLKPTTPLLTPNRGPLKPASPLHPKNAPKTPISHPQRRHRFQPHTDTSKQRRRRFQTTDPAGLQGQAAVPVGDCGARPDNEPTPRTTRRHTRRRRCGGRRRDGRAGCGARGRWRGLAGLRGDAPSHTSAHQVPLVWRAPEGPEGTGGLRDRPLRAKLACGDLAGGRALRRPEHQRSHTPHRHNKTAQPHRGRAAQIISERGSAQDHDDVGITETAFLTDARNAKLRSNVLGGSFHARVFVEDGGGLGGPSVSICGAGSRIAGLVQDLSLLTRVSLGTGAVEDLDDGSVVRLGGG